MNTDNNQIASPYNACSLKGHCMGLEAENQRLQAEIADKDRQIKLVQNHAQMFIKRCDQLNSELHQEQLRKSAWGREQIEAERNTNAILTDTLENAEARLVDAHSQIAMLLDALQEAHIYAQDSSAYMHETCRADSIHSGKHDSSCQQAGG